MVASGISLVHHSYAGRGVVAKKDAHAAAKHASATISRLTATSAPMVSNGQKGWEGEMSTRGTMPHSASALHNCVEGNPAVEYKAAIVSLCKQNSFQENQLSDVNDNSINMMY